MSGAVKTDGRVSRAQKLRESRRAGVLVAARRIFANQGYHDTSIDDIIAAAGIARGTFYLYFESKRAIFDALLDDLFVTLSATVRRIDVSPSAAPPIEQMDATVDRIFNTLVENRDMARILLRDAVGIDADFDRKLSDFYGRIIMLVIRAVRTGQEMGLVRACDARVVGHCIVGAVKEVVQYAFVELDPGQVDIRALGHELIAFALKGLFTPI